MLKYKKNLFVSHRYHAKLSIVIHKILKKKKFWTPSFKIIFIGKKIEEKGRAKR